MFELSPNGQLYKFLSRYDTPLLHRIETPGAKQVTFCVLFWHTVWVITALTAIGVAAGIISYFILGALWFTLDLISIPFFGLFNAIGFNANLVPGSNVMALLALVGVVSVVVIVVWNLCKWAVNTVKDVHRGYKRSAPTKPPGFFATWYKSHKEKYCPMVKVGES